MHCETFSFMMSHPAIYLGDRFCVSRKGRTGGGGWVHLKFSNSVAKGLGWNWEANSIVYGINGCLVSTCRDSIFSLVKFLRLAFPKRKFVNWWVLIGECG